MRRLPRNEDEYEEENWEPYWEDIIESRRERKERDWLIRDDHPALPLMESKMYE